MTHRLLLSLLPLAALLAAACGPSTPDEMTCTQVCTHNYPNGPAGALRSCLDDCAIEPRQP